MDDPNFITSEVWAALGANLKLLWGFVAAVWIFGFSLLFALGFIPSLVTSGHISPKAKRSQPLLYASATAGAVGIVFFLSQMAPGVRDAVATIWTRWFL